MAMTKVELVQTDDRRKGVRQVAESFGQGFADRIKAAKKILIKVNLSHHEQQLAATHIDAVRGLLDMIRQYSRAMVFIGDAGHYGTKAALRNFGYEQLPMEYAHTLLVDLHDDEHVDGIIPQADGGQAVIHRSRFAADCDVRISLTPMKTQCDAGVSLAVENWALGTWIVPSRVGLHGRVWPRWPWLGDEGAAGFHGAIAALYEQLPCDAAIIDGVVAMEGNGPIWGMPVAMNVVLGGLDAVAVDAVAATLMGYDPADVGYLVLATQRGFGTMDMAKIDVPPLLLSQLPRNFLRPADSQDKLSAWKSV